MNFKEFFKPTWGKILLFIILFLPVYLGLSEFIADYVSTPVYYIFSIISSYILTLLVEIVYKKIVKKNQFLRATKAKIITFIIIFVISMVDLFLSFDLVGDVMYSKPNVILRPVGFLLDKILTEHFQIWYADFIIVMSIIGTLIYWYLLSCLIIFIYDKIRSKK